jgi:hypothetical protein
MATSVPGYEHDIFVSYATVDDRPAKSGWVSAFVNCLSESMAAAIGDRDPERIWWDRLQIDEEASLTNQRLGRLPGTVPIVISQSNLTALVAEVTDDVIEVRGEVVRYLSDYFNPGNAKLDTGEPFERQNLHVEIVQTEHAAILRCLARHHSVRSVHVEGSDTLGRGHPRI